MYTNFLFPEFNTATHIIKNPVGISVEYPKNNSFTSNVDYEYDRGIISGSQVSVIRENVGYECKWSYVRVLNEKMALDENSRPLEFYILKDNLENIGGKLTYEPICSDQNSADPTALEIIPYLKEVFLPYIDKRNGLYSVRISVDYEKILDMKLFRKVVEEVYFEGVNLLLSSRGFLSDNETIDNLRKKYYTFAFVHKDFDVTVRRVCEPLTFTVSIPLNFFNQSDVLAEGQQSSKAVNFIRFTNFNFVDQIDTIIDLLTNRIEELDKALFPSKVLENFVIDFELNSLRRFAAVVNETVQMAGYPFNSSDNVIRYEICLDANLELVGINIITFDRTNEKKYSLPINMISNLKMRGDFNNKRIFNYLLKLEEMLNQISVLDVIEFYKTYVTYPSVRVSGESITINGITFNEEQIKEFRLNISNNSEACVKLLDFQNLYNAGTRALENFSDPLFHLFTLNDPKNTVSQRNITQDIKSSMEDLTKPRADLIKENGPLEFTIGEIATDLGIVQGSFISDLTGDYTRADTRSTVINSLGYFLKRINVQELILRQAICYLKGLNSDNPEVAAILAQFPNQVLNYISYIETLVNGDLSGAAWLTALEQGITFDAQLLCSDEFSYFLKGLTAIINTINVGANTAITLTKEIDSVLQGNGLGTEYRAENPYGAIAKSITRQIYNAIFEFLYDYINDILTPICDDPIYDKSADNFADPYNTHVPINIRDNPNNNDSDIVNKNRANAIQETFPEIFRELRYGVDLEYTVDLIQLLINDIKCILTPTENVNLLRGSPSEETIVLIKNIIRNKFSKDPNNLSYLLNEDKLKLFFQKLGATVDQQKLQSIINTVSKIVPANVCTPEQFQIRCELINGKLPPELNILQDDLRNRTQKVRNLLDKLKSGEKIININALCPDIQDEDMKNMKNDLAKQYSDSIRSIFTNVLNTFSFESSNIVNKIAEERTLFRMKDQNIFDQYKYHTYYSTLSSNMNNLQFDSTSEEYKTNKSHIIKFEQSNVEDLEEWQYQDLFLETSYLNASLPKDCEKPGSYKSDERFIKFLSEGRVIWENRPYNRKWDNVGKKWKDRGNNNTWASQFVQEIYEQTPDLYEYIKEKKYVLFISSETSLQYNPSVSEQDISKDIYQKSLYRDLINGESEEKIVFRFLYYTKPQGLEDNKLLELGDFRLLYEAEIKADNEMTPDQARLLNKSIRINMANYTGEIISNLQYDKRNEEKFDNISYTDFYAKYYPGIKKFFRIEQVDDNRRYGSHILDANFINISNVADTSDGAKFENRAGLQIPVGYTNQETVLNTIQEIFIRNFETSVGSIQTFEKFYQSKNKFSNKGLFNITTIQDEIPKENIRMIMIPTSTGLEDNPIEYKSFYTIRHSSDMYDTALLNSFKFELFYKSLYKAAENYYLNNFFKNSIDKKELSFIKKDGTIEQYDFGNFILGQDEDAAFYSDLANEDLKIIKNLEFDAKQEKNISKFTTYDLTSDIRYKNCNVFPHYLNLEYLLKLFEDSYKQSICDTNMDSLANDLLKEVLFTITIRANITDILIKIIPFLSLLDKNELLDLHKDKFVIDVVREHLNKEMSIFHENYFNNFLKEINILYEKESFKKKLKQSMFLEFSSQEFKILEYFISKEIKRFIKFSLEKEIIIHQPTSAYKDSQFFNYLSSAAFDVFGSSISVNDLNSVLLVLTPQQIKNEFYTIMIYILMANTIDTNKRSLFVGTKQELASIFFSNVNRESNDEIYEEKNQEDIVKFINNLSKTSDPALMVYLNPSYSKYIDFAISAIRTQTKQSLLINAVYTEPNMALTRVINRSLTAASTAAWSLIPQQQRDELMIRASVNNFAASLLYDRINRGMGPIPQQIISLSSLGAGPPGFYGIPYLALDAWDEFDWYNSAVKSIEELKKYALQDQDPCQVTDIKTDLSCKDNKDKLLQELDVYEE